MAGQTAQRADISNVTRASPCVITTLTDHGFTTGDYVRVTDLNGGIPDPRGMDQINNDRYKIIVIDLDEFSLQDPITFQSIDSSSYTEYVSGGSCNVIATDFQYNGA